MSMLLLSTSALKNRPLEYSLRNEFEVPINTRLRTRSLDLQSGLSHELAEKDKENTEYF